MWAGRRSETFNINELGCVFQFYPRLLYNVNRFNLVPLHEFPLSVHVYTLGYLHISIQEVTIYVKQCHIIKKEVLKSTKDAAFL